MVGACDGRVRLSVVRSGVVQQYYDSSSRGSNRQLMAYPECCS